MIASTKPTRRVRTALKAHEQPQSPVQPQNAAPDVAELRALEMMNAGDSLDGWRSLPASTRLYIRKALAEMSWDEDAGDRHTGDAVPMIVCGLFALGVQCAELLAGRTLAEL
ncbi:hypothetical protein Pan44_28320 [Caulifigura coniformis]|uniref:Uncharacterized protein n=1 Tax=Caulifigura coniformis TaxID=2527983 RepID=A0A517SF78_9PLAN|nr:hypothetical protein [Caulifigura coniformis]QDT54794.1 hypothetical protein Pan44_28320 [Caulifigura coniformis]